MPSKFTALNKLLILSNLILLLAVVVAAKYETPSHKRADALNALMSMGKAETLPEGHIVREDIELVLERELGRDIELSWAGIEWSRVSAMLRTHATTTEGKRYLVQMLLVPTEEQTVYIEKTEVIDVSDETTKRGLPTKSSPLYREYR